MTAATTALTLTATSGDAAKPVTQRLSAPCLGLALMAGAALWVGIGSTVALLMV